MYIYNERVLFLARVCVRVCIYNWPSDFSRGSTTRIILFLRDDVLTVLKNGVVLCVCIYIQRGWFNEAEGRYGGASGSFF